MDKITINVQIKVEHDNPAIVSRSLFYTLTDWQRSIDANTSVDKFNVEVTQ